MKILIALAILLVALPASAATYSITTTANQEAVITAAVTRLNANTCARLGLQAGCTDAQAKAVDPTATIYASNNALIMNVLTHWFVTVKTDNDADSTTKFNAWWGSLTPTQKSNICAAMNPLPSVCLP